MPKQLYRIDTIKEPGKLKTWCNAHVYKDQKKLSAYTIVSIVDVSTQEEKDNHNNVYKFGILNHARI